MKFKNLVILCLLLLAGCKLLNNPDLNISGITETDANGQFSGEIDQKDWSASVYDHIYFGPNIWISPIHEILFNTDHIQDSLSKSITVYNFSANELQLQTAVSLPFTINPADLSLSTKSLNTFTVSYIADDTLHKSGTLKINSNSGDDLTIPLRAAYKEPVIVPADTLLNTFYPAYPNPANGSITFRFCLEKSEQVSLYLRDESNLVIKRLLNNEIKPAGCHTVIWNPDNDGISAGFYRVFIKTNSLSATGDVKIED